MTSLDSDALERASAADPDWLVEARRSAFEIFSESGPPSPKDENWRYVDLDFSLSDFRLGEPPDPQTPQPAGADPGAVIVDGRMRWRADRRDDGLTIASLAEAADTEPRLKELYGGLGDVAHDQFTAASRAFAPDCAYVRVAKGTLFGDPLILDVLSEAAETVSFPRVIVDLEEGAQASVVVRYSSRDDRTALVVPEIDCAVGVNANLAITVVQDWGAATSAVARARLATARDAEITLAEAGLGGAYSRLHLSVDLEGKGSSARVVGAYFGDHAQVLDYRYFMRHVGENTTSDMFLKGGVEDEALSIFTGMIRIEESAQRTNAFQTNRNLLLSRDASAQSVPNLEILANDVKCGHGSTVGPLDEEQRYYLMSRGLDREHADRLQVRGFFEEALERFPERPVTEPIRARINAKYADALEEGRL